MHASKDKTLGRPFALRLTGGSDLRAELAAFCRRENLRAAALISLVGSLTVAKLRFAGKEEPTLLVGPFEIVSATGVLADSGAHLHVTLADAQGKLLGGHLSEGSLVSTTAEIVLLDISQWYEFERVFDARTNAQELLVKSLCDAED